MANKPTVAERLARVISKMVLILVMQLGNPLRPQPRRLVGRRDGVLFLNPGAAGRPRFGGGLSVAILTVAAGTAEAAIVELRAEP